MLMQSKPVLRVPDDPKGIQVDDLHFAVRRSARRKTMEITVERDGQLLLSAPPDVPTAQLRAFVRKKRFWIYTKLAEKDRLLRRVPRKEFVGGEGFLYLGRSFRLKLVNSPDIPLKLTAGRFTLDRKSVPVAREHFINWYTARARDWLASKAMVYCSRMEVDPVSVKVQDLGYRWGSCGKGNRLFFHWKTILLPASIAEYVVVHEIAHLHERHHTPAFWLRVERAMPDYLRRKAWLAEHGIDVEGI